METDAFFLTFLEGTEEIVKSDKACADILHWANKISIAESKNPNIENVAAFLLLGLKSEISSLVSSVKRYQSRLYDGSGKISNAEWEAIDEKNELWDLEEVISALLLDIVRRVNKSEKRYSKIIKHHKDIDYDGASFRLETVRKMRRYLDATILFLKSLDEANISIEEKTKYTSQLLEMGKTIKDESDNSNEKDDKAHSTDQYILGLLITAEIITFENHIPKIADTGVKFLRALCQEQVTNEFPQIQSQSGDQLQVTEDEAVNTFKDLNIIESDGQTITDSGLVFFIGLAKIAFSSGLPIAVASTSLEGKNIKSIEDAEEIVEDAKRSAAQMLKEHLIEMFLLSARKIEGFDYIALVWMVANKKLL
jgi:hypothetical protein